MIIKLLYKTITVKYKFLYRIAGNFRGAKFSWMLKLLLVRGKNFVVESRLNGN